MAQNEVQLELFRQRLVRESKDFNTLDAYRLLDKHAQCEVTKRELANFLINEVQVDLGNCDINAVDLIT